MIKKLIVALALCLSTTTVMAQEQGSDWSYDPYAPAMIEMTVAHIADLASTAITLAVVDTAVEANPLGWYLIPAKIAFTYGLVPLFPIEDQVDVGHIASSVTWGATANNLAILVGATGSIPIVGMVLTSGYLLGCYFEVLPESICIVGYDE